MNKDKCNVSIESIFSRRFCFDDNNTIILQKYPKFRNLIRNIYHMLSTEIVKFCHLPDPCNLKETDILKIADVLRYLFILLIHLGKHLHENSSGIWEIHSTAYANLMQDFRKKYSCSEKKYLRLLENLGISILKDKSSCEFHCIEEGLLNEWSSISKDIWERTNGIDRMVIDYIDYAEKRSLDETTVLSIEMIEKNINKLDYKYFKQFEAFMLSEGWQKPRVYCTGPDCYLLEYEPMINTIHILVFVYFGNVIIKCPFKADAMKAYFDKSCSSTKEFILQQISPYTFCSGDFCNGLISCFLEHDGRSVRICHSEEYCPNYICSRLDTNHAYQILTEMIQIFFQNDVRSHNTFQYKSEKLSGFNLIGYFHTVNPLGTQIDEFIQTHLKENDAGLNRIDELCNQFNVMLSKQYYGVILDYTNSQNYCYFLGTPCNIAPMCNQELPTGTMILQIPGGTYITIKDNNADYNGMWEFFEYTVKTDTGLRFDPTRHSFERFHDSNVKELHVPVRKSSDYIAQDVHYSVEKSKDFMLAGYTSYMEQGHPQYKDLSVSETLLRKAFPDSTVLVHGKIHAHQGKSYRSFIGVPVNDQDPVPQGMERIRIKGGDWAITRHLHPNGYHADVYVPEEYLLNTDYESAHPRPYLCFDYIGRAGSAITAIPVKPIQDYCFELYHRAPCTLIGKYESMNNPVTDEELLSFAMDGNNIEKGNYIVAFYSIKRIYAPFTERRLFMKGYLASDDIIENADLEKHCFTGGLYARVYQKMPNGEMGWGMPTYIVSNLFRDSGKKIDGSKPCFVYQKATKESYEIHVPLIE